MKYFLLNIRQEIILLIQRINWIKAISYESCSFYLDPLAVLSESNKIQSFECLKPKKYIKIAFWVLFMGLIQIPSPIFAKNSKLNIQVKTPAISMKNSNSAPIFIDSELTDFPKINIKDNSTFHLFSHGRSGELLINGKWKSVPEIGIFLASRFKNLPQPIKNLNIYGCEFAKGEKGMAAIAYLERTLGVSVAASNNITGKGGDWILEIGESEDVIALPNYAGSLQTTVGLLGVAPGGGPSGTGPSITNKVVTLYTNSTTALSPTVTATYSLSNQQFLTPEGFSPAVPGSVFGAAGSTTANNPPAARNFYYTLDRYLDVTSSFTSCSTCTAGTGVTVSTNYGIQMFNFTDALIDNVGIGQPLYLYNARVYYADLNIHFNVPVSNPVLHLADLGSYNSYGDGTYSYDLGYTTDYDLISGQTLTKLSGTTYFGVTSTSVANTATWIGGNGSGAFSLNGVTRYPASGSVVVNGTNITDIKFKMYIRGDGGRYSQGGVQVFTGSFTSYPRWSTTTSINGDALLMGLNLQAPVTVSGNVFNDPNGGTVDNSSGVTNAVPSGIYANLLDTNGNVVASVAVNTDGTYSFPSVFVGTYTVQISTTAGTQGSPAPAQTLPTAWASTGESNNAPPGTPDATVNGVSASFTVASTNVTNINFGIKSIACTYGASTNGLPTATDSDGDGINDTCDLDDDNDGILDVNECPQQTVEVYTYNDASTAFASTASVTITGSNVVDMHYDQRAIANNLTYNGKNWQLLTNQVYPAPDGSIKIKLNGATTGTYLVADAMLVKIGSNIIVIDNGDANFSTVGTWTSQALGYLSDRLIATPAPYTGKTATWNFTSLPFTQAICAAQTNVDSDGDGCPDALEGGGGFTTLNINGSNRLTGGVDANGVPLTAGTNGQTVGSSQNASVLGISCVNNSTDPTKQCESCDYDGDGIPNIIDLDDDNDGILDEVECPSSVGTLTPLTTSEYNMVGQTNYPLYAQTQANLTNATITSLSSPDVGNSALWNQEYLVDNGNYLDGNFQNQLIMTPAAPNNNNLTGIALWTPGISPTYGDGPLRQFTITVAYSGGTWTSPIYTTLQPTAVGSPNLGQYFPFNKVFNGVTQITLKTLNGWYNQNTDYPSATGTSWIPTTQAAFYGSSSVWNETYNMSLGEFRLDIGGTISGANCDLDGDGIPNKFDLDSDGDGCPDAIEGGASFTTANLVTSSMPGGNSGTGYTGTSTNQVTTNLGNTVGSTSTTMGVPTIAGTGQTVGTSQNGSVLDPSCPPPCNAGTTAPTLNATTATNTCPTTTVNLNSLVTSTTPTGASLVWFTNNTHTGTAVTNPVSVGGTYYAFYFDATNNCYSPASVGVVVSMTICCPINTVTPILNKN